ncbi:MAG: sugar ABC transporter permease [Anaerolineae bacterium]|nr:sugar ABC transporter permease [Anaerolineae bacterium]
MDATTHLPRGRSTLGRGEALWGYLFIAAPLLGFLIFSAFPLLVSLFLSFTSYDLATAPRWIGTENWSRMLSVTMARVPPMTDEATGETLFRCGRETVTESRIGEFAGQTDLRGNPITCAPRLMALSDVLPSGYETVYNLSLFGNDYVLAARDPIFWISLFNTAFMLIAIPISMALALLIALALNQKIQGARFFRTLFYLPTILPIAALALVWLWILNPDYGLLNFFLKAIGLSELGSTNWLQNAYTVKPALIIMAVWRGFGYQMVIFLAGLQGVNRTLYEAAEIDGAGTWAKFRYVTWPALTPTTFFLFITSLIGALQIFQEPQIMTQGQPYFSSTMTVMVIWQNAFRDLQMGYAATQAWLLGGITMVLTVINFVLSRRWVFYD